MASRLRAPFIVTVATAAACGGNVTVFDGGSGGASTSASSGVTNTNAGTSGTQTTVTAGTSTGVTATSGPTVSASSGTSVNCPMTLPASWDDCDLAAGEVCTYDVKCQGGVNTFSFACGPSGFGWQVSGMPDCEYAYDSCPGTDLYCAETWSIPEGTNPPSPCPEVMPKEGDKCPYGGFGGVWTYCGYACSSGDPAQGWTIAECVAPTDPNDFEGTWTLDAACTDSGG